jgi:uncharacterized protein YlzI (FlbEa/FlbD family)
MSEYITAFIPFTKLDGLRTMVGACTIDRLEELPGGRTRIIQDHTYIDVQEDVLTVEQAIGAKHIELAQFEGQLRDHEDGEDWKFGA